VRDELSVLSAFLAVAESRSFTLVLLDLPTAPPARRLQTVTFVHSVHTLEVMNSAYVSGRVPACYERLVTKQARAARTSKSDLVARDGIPGNLVS
jgi:hypothetical protein